MKMLRDREVKVQFFIISVVLLIFTITGQVIVNCMVNEYKQNMIVHDYEVAGYMVHSGVGQSQIIKAFTLGKTEEDIKDGYKLLKSAGYDRGTKNSLIKTVSGFQKKFVMINLINFTVFSAVLYMVFLYFQLRQNRKIIKAGDDIQSFMDGNIYIRLPDQEEGILSKLFASVNIMATSLTALMEKEKLNKEFLQDTISDISHQLKTPLAALQMYIEIIKDEIKDNDVVDSFISKSQRELNRMESLIQNLLKLARLDAGTIELEKNSYSLRELLSEIIRGFSTRATLEGKHIHLNCNECIELICDEEWMIEAVSNIIKNALDHTDSCGEIEVQCNETPILIEIEIKDDGTGIHMEDIHHIFKRFYRSRFSKDKQGIGIGLALAKAIVEKHDGYITVESELGKGTVFRLLFQKLSNM